MILAPSDAIKAKGRSHTSFFAGIAGDSMLCRDITVKIYLHFFTSKVSLAYEIA